MRALPFLLPCLVRLRVHIKDMKPSVAMYMLQRYHFKVKRLETSA